MSNTYFEIKKEEKEPVRFNSNEHANVESTLNLCAFMSGKSSKNIV